MIDDCLPQINWQNGWFQLYKHTLIWNIHKIMFMQYKNYDPDTKSAHVYTEYTYVGWKLLPQNNDVN